MLHILCFSFILQNGIRLQNGNYHKIVGTGPPVIFSSGFFGTMPSFMYGSIINDLKTNMTLILPSGNPIKTATVTEIADKLNVQKVGFFSHSSFDYEILNNDVVEKAVVIDPVSFPELPLRSRTVKPLFDVLTFTTRLSQETKIPFIPDAFEMHIKTNNQVMCEDVGHSDILDDTWAEIADSIGIKGAKEVSMNDLQNFSNWKFLKMNDKKKVRSAFRTMVCDRIRGFILDSHLFEDVKD